MDHRQTVGLAAGVCGASSSAGRELPQCTRDPNTCEMDFCDFPRCLREHVAQLMVERHMVRRELVEQWVAEMTLDDMARRLAMYARLDREREAEMELSAESPKTERATSFLASFDDSATMTAAGSRHSILFPTPDRARDSRQETARFGGRKLAPMAARVFGARR